MERTATATTITAGGGAIIFGLSANEFAAIVGAGVAVLSFLFQIAITLYFKSEHLKLAKLQALRGEQDPCDVCPKKGTPQCSR